MMTGKSKFKAPKLRTVGTLRPSEQPEPKFTLDEMRLIRAYRACSDKTQEFMVKCAESHATDPMLMRHKKRPDHLRLVALNGGA
jgi:hypothetical protein